MYLRSLYLHQFRNYKEAYFEFDPVLNLICGPNAQGKTNLLEAIYYLMIGRSFRSTGALDSIQLGASSFYLEAIFCKHEIDQKLRFYLSKNERKIIYNTTPLTQISNLLGLIQGVVMTPDDVNLVKGSPLLRRQFLDIQIAQADPLYVYYLARYIKAMRQRNQLLKQKILLSIESWEHEMAYAASYIIMQRRIGLHALQTHCQKFYSYLTSELELLTLSYCSEAKECMSETDIKEFYIQKFQKNRSKEMLLGYTLSGPHKDDIWIGINERDVRYFASEGQQRSCVSALYMGEWVRLQKVTQDFPLFMMDDIGISLDEKRRKRLIEQLSSFGQIFLTTTDPHIADSFEGSKKVFSLPFTV